MSEVAASETGPRTRDPVRPIDVLLSIVALTGFAVAQPFYDLLDENAEFFLVRGSSGVDVVLFVLGVSVAVPLVLTMLALGARLVHRRAGAAVHAGVLALLAALFLLPIMRRIPAVDGAPGAAVLALAVVLGAAAAVLFFRVGGVRVFLRFSSAAALVFPVLFIFASPSSSVVFAGTTDSLASSGAKNPVPIVMVVFDEFPLPSLLDGNAEIDRARYPGFSELGDDALWYRNAVTPHDFTTWAVPAMLTGVRPPAEWRPPTLATHPNNLFTLLRDDYEVRAFEAVTRLCPVRVCENAPTRPPPPTFAMRWRSMLSDLRIVSGHLYLPEDYRRGLPPIDETVGGFATEDPSEGASEAPSDEPARPRPGHDELVSDRVAMESAFLRSIERAPYPRLHFVHLFLPHRPWEFLPTGQRYPEIVPPAKQKRGWRDDEWLVAQAQQQHLLQAAYADRFVERLVRTLKRQGIYEETLIVIAADHGIAFEPGVERSRFVTRSTIGEIASVPLFVKLPGSSGEGRIVDRRVETLDIVPTIADVVGARIPWRVSGGSLLADSSPPRRSTVCSASSSCVTFGPGRRHLLDAVARKVRRFPDGDPYQLAPAGYESLLGRQLTGMRVRQGSHELLVHGSERYGDVDPAARVLPVALTGELPGASRSRHDVLAIAVHDRIVAITRTYVSDEGDVSFLSMLPPDALRAGRNDVEVLVVDGSGADPVLVSAARIR